MLCPMCNRNPRLWRMKDTVAMRLTSNYALALNGESIHGVK